MISPARIVRFSAAAVLATLALGTTGCTDDPVQPTSKAGTFYGASIPLGGGTARSYVTLDSAGKPTDLGVALSESALTNLPDTSHHAHELMYTLALPAQASATPFNHIGLDWNPAGHEPAQFYMLPHFDFHFYMISSQERDAITAVGADTLKLSKMPAASEIPAGYVPTPGGAPRMGAHWIDPTSPEFTGKGFSKTFIYGFYNGKMIFLEPMITKATIEAKANTTDTLKLPQAYPKSGYYPTTYSVKFDATAKEYRISLGGMKLR